MIANRQGAGNKKTPAAGFTGLRRLSPSVIGRPPAGGKRADGREQTYRIVGEDEADPVRGTISYVSPVALLGKQVGEAVRVGISDIELVAINRSYPLLPHLGQTSRR